MHYPVLVGSKAPSFCIVALKPRFDSILISLAVDGERSTFTLKNLSIDAINEGYP